MIVSKEVQEKAVYDFLQSNSVEKTEAFISGMNKAFEIVDKIEKEAREQNVLLLKYIKK